MYETDDVNSELINSYAWDTAILFIQKNGQNNYSRQESLNTETDGLLNTGISGDKQCYTNSRNASSIENYSEYHSFRPILYMN